MKEISIEVTKQGERLGVRSSKIPEIIETNLAQAFRHDIEGKNGDYIIIELLNDGDVVTTIEGSCDSNDFDHFYSKVSGLFSQLD